jgi:hypothetical protein
VSMLRACGATPDMPFPLGTTLASLQFSKTAPRARVCDREFASDGPISTTVGVDAALSLCTSRIGDDYGPPCGVILKTSKCHAGPSDDL